MKAKFSSPKMMNTKDLEKEIVKEIREQSKIPFYTGDRTEMEMYKELIKTIKHLFNEYRGERLYITGTVIGLLKGDK